MQDSAMINEAVDEFIQDKRLWFRDLHRDHADDFKDAAKEKGNDFLPGTAKFIGKGLLPVAGELDIKSAEYAKILKERTLAFEQKFQEDADKRGSDDDETSDDEADEWDAETILTTHTNTDNHPGIIKFTPKIKVKNQIILDKQFKVPIDGLNGLIPTAEVISQKKKEKKQRSETYFEEDSESDEIDTDEDEEKDGADGEVENPKKAAKKAMKAERREKRKQKKELKVAFKN